ncbi:MAG: DUF4292 domain-containing protein [Bacteroidales bacterium]|nr:DUF4292 domain-containing protein [Bacteroidales bacterium]
MKFLSFNIRFLIGVLVMVLIFGSCKTAIDFSKRDIVQKEDRVLRDIDISSPAFRSYNVKLDIELSGISYSGTLRMVKDSAIWLSVGKFGFEGIRILMTKDSVWVLNKLEREYFAGDYDFFRRVIGLRVSYDMAQGLLLGKDFAEYDSGGYRLETNKNILRYIYDSRSNIIDINSPTLKQDLFFDRSSKHIIRNYFEVIGNKNSFDAYYDSYFPLKGFSFPNNIRINAVAEKTIRLVIRLENHKVNEVFDMPFSIPKSYSLMK